MAGKFYAVRKGKTTGIFLNWDQCKAQVHGFPCAEYKSFKTRDEAEDYLNASQKLQEKQQIQAKEMNTDCVEVYVDGSYDKVTGAFSYGMIFLLNGTEQKFCKKYQDAELSSMHNVAGEIKGAEAAMRYARDHKIPYIKIYHDYEGIAKWCLGDWKTNKDGTKAYKAFYDEVKEQVMISFSKVTGHSNDKYNDMADELAKQALGLIAPVHEAQEY